MLLLLVLYFYEIRSPEMARADLKNERSLLVCSLFRYAISVHLFPFFSSINLNLARENVQIHDLILALILNAPFHVENCTEPMTRRHPIR